MANASPIGQPRSPNGEAAYNRLAKFLHWLIALLIIGMLAIGWIMTDHDLVSGPLRFSLFQWHKSIGITILALSLFRLAWRLMNSPPPLPTTMPAWEVVAAKISHWLFYVLIIGMPISGWLLVSASPFKTMMFGLFQLPEFPGIAELPQKQEFGERMGDIHCYLAYGILGLLLLHIGAAWKHHLLSHDDVLLRMAPDFLHPLLRKLRGRK